MSRRPRHLHYSRPIDMSEANMLVDALNRKEADLAAAQAEVARLNQSLLDCSRDWDETCQLIRKEAEAEAAAMRVDAERYRWLRDIERYEEIDGSIYVRQVQFTQGTMTGSSILVESELDAAIDAARGGGNG